MFANHGQAQEAFIMILVANKKAYIHGSHDNSV
jgi:hypothetical protein